MCIQAATFERTNEMAYRCIVAAGDPSWVHLKHICFITILFFKMLDSMNKFTLSQSELCFARKYHYHQIKSHVDYWLFMQGRQPEVECGGTQIMQLKLKI